MLLPTSHSWTDPSCFSSTSSAAAFACHIQQNFCISNVACESPAPPGVLSESRRLSLFPFEVCTAWRPWPNSFSLRASARQTRISYAAHRTARVNRHPAKALERRRAKGPPERRIGSERRPKSFALVGPSKSGFTIAVCHSPLPLKLFTHNVIVTAASIDQARLLVLVLAGTIGHLSFLTSEPCLLQRGFLNICRAHDERPQIPAFAARPIALS